MPKPRVLILQTHAKNGGTQELAKMLAAGLSARGHEVSQVYLVLESDFLHDGENITYGLVPRTHGPLGYVHMAIATHRELRRLKPDIVICMQWGSNFLCGFVSLLLGSPPLISRQFDSPTQMPGWPRWIDRLQGQWGAFARIVVNSGAVEQGFAGYPESYRRRMVRIDHGIAEKTSALSRSEARARFGLPQGVPLLGSVARLASGKNFGAAIRLLPDHPDWHLVLGGHGPEKERLLTLAQRLGCGDRLHLAGEINPDSVGDFLAALDVFVFPTLAETFGLAAVEAAQAGVPVVANDVPVLREVLAVDGKPCAMFAEASNTAAFGEAVSRVLEDAALREQVRSIGAQLKDRYSAEKMFDAYDRLIRSVLVEERA
jgi:glycosyltransferase involved in cell wall biosynthesis